MSNFKVGQKVVCISDASIDVDTGKKNIAPKINEIVKISDISHDGWLTLVGYPYYIEYENYHFRPLDHQFAEDVIAMITEQVKEEELVNI